jgi:hypothetical protein
MTDNPLDDLFIVARAVHGDITDDDRRRAEQAHGDALWRWLESELTPDQ